MCSQGLIKILEQERRSGENGEQYIHIQELPLKGSKKLERTEGRRNKLEMKEGKVKRAEEKREREERREEMREAKRKGEERRGRGIPVKQSEEAP